MIKILRNATPKYFSFDLDSLESPLPCKSLSEKLFLTYFFKAQGDYESALAEFQKLQTLNFDEQALDTLAFIFFT